MKYISWFKRNYQFTVVTAAILIVGFAITWQLAARSSDGEKELNRVKGLVAQHLLLPTDEEPTLATVEDKTKVTDKYLASKAENGDQILIYSTNKQAIIYRPKIDKVVAVAPLTVDMAAAEAEGATITVLNGTKDAALATKIEQDVKTAYPAAKVSVANANRRDFPTSLVIVNSGDKNYLHQSLLKTLGAKDGVVPVGEEKTGANIIILVGQDKL